MPDIASLLNSGNQAEKNSTQASVPSAMESDKAMRQQQQQKESLNNVDVNTGGNDRFLTDNEKKNAASNIKAQNRSSISSQLNQPGVVGEGAVGADKTQKEWIAEAGSNIIAGVGRDIVGSTGTVVNMLGGLLGVNEYYEGNWVGRKLEEAGAGIQEKYGTKIPENLRNPEMSLQTFMDPQFWSVHAASYIPQLVEFIFLSKGVGALTRKGANASAKSLSKNFADKSSGLLKAGRTTRQGTTKSASTGAKVATEELNVGGALKNVVRDTGELTSQAAMVSETIGAGLGGNIFSGLLNASQLVKEKAEMVGPDGSPLYSDEELGNMAAGVMQRNLAYLPVDILSWGMTYGNGANILKGMKGGGVASRSGNAFKGTAQAGAKRGVGQAGAQAEQAAVKGIGQGAQKQIGSGAKRIGPKGKPGVGEDGAKKVEGLTTTRQHSDFAGKISPISEAADNARKKSASDFMVTTGGFWKGIGKFAAKPLKEGFEETIQETYEEWVQMRAFEDATGTESRYGDPDNFMEFDLASANFWDFYMSKESESTRAIAGALGFMGGAGANLVSSINETSERERQLLNSTENLKTIFKSGDEKGKTMRKFHMQELASDAVLNGKVEDMMDHVNSFMENGSVTEEEIAEVEQMIADYQALDEQAEKLNVRGKVALFKNYTQENYLTGHLEEMQTKLNENIEIINAQPYISENDKQKKIANLEKEFQKESSGIMAGIAQASQNKGNLLLGKKADNALKIDYSTGVNGETVPVVGLVPSDYQYYVEDSSEDILAGKKKYNSTPFGKLARKDLKGNAKAIYDKLAGQFWNKVKPDGKTESEETTDTPQEGETASSEKEAKPKGEQVEYEPLTKEEQSEVAKMQEQVDLDEQDLSSLKSKVEKVKKAFAPGKGRSDEETKQALAVVKKYEEKIAKAEKNIAESKNKIKKMTTKPKVQKAGESDIDSSAPSNLKDAKATDEKIHPNVVKQLANLIKKSSKKAKSRLTPKQQALYEKFENAVDSFIETAGGRTKQFTDFVNSQEFTETIKKNKAFEKAQKMASSGKDRTFQAANALKNDPRTKKAKNYAKRAANSFMRNEDLFEGREQRTSSFNPNINNLSPRIEQVNKLLGHPENIKRFEEFRKLLNVAKDNLTEEQINTIVKVLSKKSVAIIGGTTDPNRNMSERGDFDTAWVDNMPGLDGRSEVELSSAYSKLFLWLQSENNTRQQPEVADHSGAGGINIKPTSKPIYIGDIVVDILSGTDSHLKSTELTTQEITPVNGVTTQGIVPFQEAAKYHALSSENKVTDALQKEIPSDYTSKIGMLKYGPSNVDIMSAVNERMSAVFPNMKQAPRVIVLDDLRKSLGIRGTGYAIASTVYVQRDKWDQGKTFMHEMTHVFYNMSKDEPATKKIIDQIMREKQDLIKEIIGRYPDLVKYNFKQEDGTIRTGRLADADVLASKKELADAGITIAPLSEQNLILEEAFAAFMEGPLSKKYNNFFSPREEFERQKKAVSFWNPIAIQSKENGGDQDNLNLLNKLLDSSDIEANANNMRDFILERFEQEVGTINDGTIGFEDRKEKYKSVTQEQVREQMKDLEAQQAVFEKSVFDTKDNIRKNMELKEATDEEIQEKNYNDGISPLTALLNKTFQGKMGNATKILRQFIKDYNKAVRVRKAYGIEAPLFDRRDFMYKIFEYARFTDDVPTFINEMNNSTDPAIVAFMEFLKIKAVDKKGDPQNKVILNGIKMVMGNFKMVNAVHSTLVKDDNGNISVQLNESLSQTEAGRVQNMMASMQADREANMRDYNNGTVSRAGTRYGDFRAALDRIKNDRNATPEDYFNAWHYIASNGNIKMQDILAFNHMNHKGSSYTPATILKSFVDKNLHVEQMRDKKTDELLFNDNGTPKMSNFPSAYNFKPLANILAVTNRSFTQDSLVQNAKNDSVPVRITNNNISKEIDQLRKALRIKEDGTRISKEDFVKMFSHVTGKKDYSATSGNLWLSNFYDRSVNQNIDTDMVYYTGIDDRVSNKQKVYEESTAYEQSYEDFMMWANNPKASTYLHNMGVLGDSPRKFYIPATRIKYSDVYTSDGKLNIKSEVLKSAYDIHRNTTVGSKTPQEFLKTLENDIQKELRFFEKNSKSLRKMKPLADSFTSNGKLNSKGERMVKEYVINAMANGMYLTEVFAPNIKSDEIEKRMKNSSSPVYSVNENLKFEPIVFQDGKDFQGNDATDGGMYILEEDAVRWRNAGMGVMDLNSGFKFLNYSIEKDNSKFAGQTMLLKGYTTVLSDAEVAKNPKLQGLYDLMKARKAKYNEWHQNKYGFAPTMNFSDGMPNSFPIAIPQSSIKGNKKLSEDPTAPKLHELTHKDPKEAEKLMKKATDYFDNLMYSKDNFIGLSAYNFGPQQVMDKQTYQVSLPVQQVNSLLVYADTPAKLAEAEAIQQLYADQMTKNINDVINKIGNTGSIKGYEEFLKKNLDMDSMDPVQRRVIEKYGINHSRAHQVIVNTLANQLKVMGNKLQVAGTYAHQKSDYGYQLPHDIVIGNETGLRGYGVSDGKNPTRPAEIVLPGHLKEEVNAREYIVPGSELGDTALKILNDRKGPGVGTTNDEDLQALRIFAEKRSARSGNPVRDARNSKGELIGYYVEGDRVIATRVPSNGPNFTGVFEAIDFNTGEGNQVQVPASWSKIAGADLDGDALFIQHKKQGYGNAKVNEAIDRTIDLWLSPDMYAPITTVMDTKGDGNKLKSYLEDQFKELKESSISFTPQSRRLAYENSMVAKRNIGTVFNLHRTSNVLAAYNAHLTKDMFKVNGKDVNNNKRVYNRFTDDTFGKQPGEKSRNYNSALIANLILDNLKEQTADAINLNEHTVSAFTLLVNLGVPVEDVAVMMNAPMVKEYVDIQNENNSAYNGYTKKAEQMKALSTRRIENPKELHASMGKYAVYKKNDKNEFNAVATINGRPNPLFYSSSNQSAIIDLISRMETLNGEIQSISKIMAGHNGIETNPHLLEKQLKEFNIIMNNEKSYIKDGKKKMDQMLSVPPAMFNNPDIKRYRETAEKTLVHTKTLDSVYRPAVTKLMQKLGSTIQEDGLTNNQIKKYSNTIQQFLNSRLLGSNNYDPKYLEELIDPKNKNSVFAKMTSHIQTLLEEKKMNTNMLLTQGLNMVLSGNRPIISMNKNFFDESVVDQEFNRMEKEFENLPVDLQEDLFMYDLLTHRWDSTYSILPIMGKWQNNNIMNALDADFKGKNNEVYDPKILKELERIIVAKDFKGDRNNFQTVNVNEKQPGRGTDGALEAALGSSNFFKNKMLNNEPFYFIRNMKMNKKSPSDPDVYEKKLMYFPGIKGPSINNNEQTKLDERLAQARETYQIVPTDDANLDISLVTIKDPGKPTYTPNRKKKVEGIFDDEAGMESREEYWRYNAEREMTQDQFNDAMEFDKNDNPVRINNLYEKYLTDKTKANEVYRELIQDKDLESLSDDKLQSMYSTYAAKNPYAYAIVTTPLIKAMAAKLSAEQSAKTGRFQTNDDISAMMAFFMSDNVPSNHPAAQGIVREINAEHKRFMGEKRKYAERINGVTDALYQKVFGFNMKSKTPWNLFRRLYYSFAYSRKNLYEQLYGPLVLRETVYADTKPVEEFKLKSREAIDNMYKDGLLSQEHYDFYNTFTDITTELRPYSTEAGRKRKDYIPHVNMTLFESFANRGLLGVLANSKPEDERILDIKLKMKNPETKADEMWTFKEVQDFYKAMAVRSGNDISKIKEYVKLKQKAKSLLKEDKNEDGSRIVHNPMEMDSALNLGVMNRFTRGRSMTAQEMPTMDLNHALMTFTHATLFVNGNQNITGFKKIQAKLDGILAIGEDKNLGNINKYLKINWKDRYLQGKSQVLFGKKTDDAIDLVTKLNLFYQLGGKVSYVVGNIAAGKYQNIKNGTLKGWAVGEKRFWGFDNISNPLDIPKKMKRAQRILKNLNFMDINIYDNVSMQSANRLDNFFGDLALMPMAWSEKWIQGVQMLGMLTEEEWNKFDDNGDYRAGEVAIDTEKLNRLEDQVKLSQGKGYQMTDQRMIQQYSLGRMFMQFARFVPTMFHNNFAKEDINIYGRTHIGSLRAMHDTVMKVQSLNPSDYKRYMDRLKKENPDKHARVMSGLKGLSMSSLIGAYAIYSNSELANNTYWDANYYANFDKLSFKLTPSAVRGTENMLDSLFGSFGGEGNMK